MTEYNCNGSGTLHDFASEYVGDDVGSPVHGVADNSWITNRGENGVEEDLTNYGKSTPSYSMVGVDYGKIPHTINRETSWDAHRLPLDPVNRQVVEKVQAPEITQNVRYMFESGQIPDLHEVRKMIPDLEPAPGSGVFENEPIQIEGVVRSGDIVEEEEVQKGITKDLLVQWKEKGNEEFRADRSPINIADAEGKVLENDPIRRNDVVREEDCDDTNDVLHALQGQARVLKEQWVNMKDNFVKDDRPIKLIENENDGSVAENDPERRTDVLREEDNLEEIWLKKGFTRDLTGYWSTPVNDMKQARDRPIDLPKEDGEFVFENQPIRLEGVVRGEDLPDDEILAIEQCKARTMASKWKNMKEETKDRQPFRLDMEVDAKEVGVYENQPDQLQAGVVRSTDLVEEIITQQGVIKTMAGRFIETEEGPRERKEMIKIDLAEGPEVLENDPVPVGADVVRSDYIADENVVERGTTQHLVHRWKTQDLEGTSPKKVDRSHEDPRWILEAERAQESGVFENEPTVRTDVIREEDYEPEMVPAKQTKNMREVWSRMGEEKKSGVGPQQVRFTPPRELTPPRFYQEEFKSTQRLTLSPKVDQRGSSPNYTPSPTNRQYSPGGQAQHPLSQGGVTSNDTTMTSSAMFVLK